MEEVCIFLRNVGSSLADCNTVKVKGKGKVTLHTRTEHDHAPDGFTARNNQVHIV